MRPIRVLSREIDLNRGQNYPKSYICKILYKILNIKQIIFNKDATNLKTSICQKSLRNSSLLLFLSEFNNFSFLIDIIDNIIYASGTCHQNSNQWRCSIIVTSLCLNHVTSILHCRWKEFWSRDKNVYLTHTFWYNFDTVLCYFLEQEHQIELVWSRSTPEILRF